MKILLSTDYGQAQLTLNVTPQLIQFNPGIVVGTLGTEVDPVFSAWDKSTGVTVTNVDGGTFN